MSDPTKALTNEGTMTFRDRFAARLGVSPERKAEIYLELARSTTLADPSYWLQTLFAAGIATLGLVLNSPAVIIGAMLISPLMGPILASGLALATGDVVLGLRSAVNLALSCLLAIGFAFLLVAALPFKEITSEIAARMHPNTLDLAVALFSGAIGSIAICKEVKGVVTSIPGVAIAVALMPPLGVVGYGLALAAGLNAGEGMNVALGGGLLFLTNLVAIIFTAMVVFLALHIDAPIVKEQIEEWHRADSESIRFRDALKRLPGVPGVRRIGTLPARLLMILTLILVILIPLSRSFNQLKSELSQQNEENRVRQLVTQTWQQDFGSLLNGQTRSFLDHVYITNQDGKLTLQLRVLTTKPLTSAEKEQFNRAVAIKLARPPESLVTQVIEIPTASAALRPKTTEAPLPLSVAQLQSAFMQRIAGALSSVYLPPPAQLVDYRIVNSPPNGLDVILTYLGERDIEPDAQALIQQDVRTRLDYSEATIKLERVPVSSGQLSFKNGEVSLDRANQQALDIVGGYLQQHEKLRTVITGSGDQKQDQTTQERLGAVKDYLSSHWNVAGDRITLKQSDETARVWLIHLGLAE